MRKEKGLIVDNESRINKIIKLFKIYVFGEKIRRKEIQDLIEILKKENEYLKKQDKDNKLIQVLVSTNEKRIALLNYRKKVKKSKNRKQKIIVE